MEVKETRGRPKKYDFSLKIGQFRKMTFSTGARVSALAYAKLMGWKFRTWQDKGKLFVKRIN